MLELVLIFVHIHRYSLTHSFQLSTYNFELVTYDLWRMIFDNRLEKKLVGVTGFEPMAFCLKSTTCHLRVPIACPKKADFVLNLGIDIG